YNRQLPDLHTFPTRRSSDLSSTEAIVPATSNRMVPNFKEKRYSSAVKTSKPGTGTMKNQRKTKTARTSERANSDRHRVPVASLRSEEHTSELQSLRHLVCRL